MINENVVLINSLYYVFPILIGSTLSLVSIQKKYFTKRRYIFMLWQTWVYVVLSSFGALLVTLTLRYIGTEIIGHSLLNCILLSLLGSGLFLGIISKFPLSGSTNNEAGEQLKTIRDFVYEFLDMSIDQKIRQIVQSKLKNFSSGRTYEHGIYIPSNQDEQFLREVKRLIKGRKLSSDKQAKLITDFDEFIQHGDYASVIQVLVDDEYYDLDYLINELSGFRDASSPKEQRDKETPKSFSKSWRFRFLGLISQWFVGFVLWLGLGLLIAGILHKISPTLINSIILNYLKLNLAIAFGASLLIIGVLAFLILRDNK